MKVIKVYKEEYPALKLIGKRYTDQDRDPSGSFASYWELHFRENWNDVLTQIKHVDGISEDLVGAMRINESGTFEYWIGALFAPDAQVPDIFQSAHIPAGPLGVCWLYGNDKNGELYSTEASDLAMSALKQQGWNFSDKGWFFERYNCPRFTTPDEEGNVILDVCAYLI